VGGEGEEGGWGGEGLGGRGDADLRQQAWFLWQARLRTYCYTRQEGTSSQHRSSSHLWLGRGLAARSDPARALKIATESDVGNRPPSTMAADLTPVNYRDALTLARFNATVFARELGKSR